MIQPIVILSSLALLMGCPQFPGLEPILIVGYQKIVYAARFTLSSGKKIRYFQFRTTFKEPEELIFLVQGKNHLSFKVIFRYFRNYPNNAIFYLLDQGKPHSTAPFSRDDSPEISQPEREFIQSILDKQDKIPKKVIVLGLSAKAVSSGRIFRSTNRRIDAIVLENSGMIPDKSIQN